MSKLRTYRELLDKYGDSYVDEDLLKKAIIVDNYYSIKDGMQYYYINFELNLVSKATYSSANSYAVERRRMGNIYMDKVSALFALNKFKLERYLSIFLTQDYNEAYTFVQDGSIYCSCLGATHEDTPKLELFLMDFSNLTLAGTYYFKSQELEKKFMEMLHEEQKSDTLDVDSIPKYDGDLEKDILLYMFSIELDDNSEDSTNNDINKGEVENNGE